jgi:tripartite-type tricarboxylate transporter receptor subunit TctC
VKKQAWRIGLTGLLCAAVIGAGCSATTNDPSQKASGYPKKSIEYIVPFAAGGGVDLVARAVADAVSKEWGQSIAVVNKPGAGGAIGAEYALKQAKRDGYTVLADNVSSTSMLAAGMVNPPVKIEDRQLASRIVLDPVAFAVKSDAPWKDFAEFSAWAKEHPDQLTWTSVGPSGLSAFAVADWMTSIGADMSKTRMITTTGAADSIPKVAGGHAILAVHTVAEVYPMAEAGKIRVLAVGSDKRSPYLPNVPTLQEQGVANFSTKWWTGVTFAKGTPPDVIAKWESTLQKLTQDPEFLEQAKKIHVEVSYQNAQDFTEFVQQETSSYTKLATDRGMRK